MIIYGCRRDRQKANLAMCDTCQYCEKQIEECGCTLVCECGFQIDEDSILNGKEECESCRNKTEKAEWVEETCEQVEQLAERYGWELPGSGWQWANTGSRYAELSRGRWINEDTDDEDYEEQTLKIRVSDHATCYCIEDISLAKEGSGDDSTIEHLAALLARDFEADQ